MENQNNSFSDRRAEVRLPINAAITLTILPDNYKIEGVCCNMSASGILIRSKEKVKAGTQLLLTMQEGKIDFSSEGEVIRLVEDDKEYLIAIKLNQ